jgi:hypothetical protein
MRRDRFAAHESLDEIKAMLLIDITREIKPALKCPRYSFEMLSIPFHRIPNL